MAIKGGRPENRHVVAHLMVRGADQAVAFYKHAFGAVELYRSTTPSGKGMHYQLQMANSVVLVSEEQRTLHPEATMRSPETLGGTSVIVELYVDDVDAAFQRALEAGAKTTIPISDQFFDDRYGHLMDPFGHIWGLATVKEVDARTSH